MHGTWKACCRRNKLTVIEYSLVNASGVIVGLLGVEPEEDKGKFHVEEVCFQPLGKQEPRPSIDEDRLVQFR